MPARSTLPARRDAIDTTGRDDDEANGDVPKGSPKTVKHTIFGEEFHLYTQINAFNALAVTADPDDTGPLYRLILGLIKSDERPKFKSVMGQQDDLTGEKLGEIFEGMLEAVSGANPSRTSRGSSSSARRTGGTKRSAASSSSRAMTRRR